MNVKNDFESHVANPQSHEKFFYCVTAAWFILVVVSLVISLLMTTTSEQSSIPLWQIILGVVLIWSASSVKKIDPDELGAILFWGKTMIPVRRGPKFVITGIFQLERFKASVRQNQFPDDPEFIQKTGDKEPLEEVKIQNADGTVTLRSKVRPIRIATGKPNPGSEDDILNVQMVIEFTFWARWIVVEPFLYIVNTDGNDDASRAAAVVKQMRDAGESALSKQVTKMTPSELISKFDELQTELQKAVTEQVKPWGVKVVSLGMTAPDLNHEVASALRDIPKERAIAVQVRTQADAKAYQLSTLGKGEGKRREERLAGEGRGYSRLAKSIKITGEEALAAQVARDTVGKGDLIVGLDGVSQAIGLGKAVLDRSKKTDKED